MKNTHPAGLDAGDGDVLVIFPPLFVSPFLTRAGSVAVCSSSLAASGPTSALLHDITYEHSYWLVEILAGDWLVGEQSREGKGGGINLVEGDGGFGDFNSLCASHIIEDIAVRFF